MKVRLPGLRRRLRNGKEEERASKACFVKDDRQKKLYSKDDLSQERSVKKHSAEDDGRQIAKPGSEGDHRPQRNPALGGVAWREAGDGKDHPQGWRSRVAPN